MSLVTGRAVVRAFFTLTLSVLVLAGGLLSYAAAAPGGKAAPAQTCGESQHPSGKDRCVENGGSGAQGRSKSDPDGDSNGGLDKPGGDGGVNTADQDGNNGCGNDQDFEDDNNGWCGRKPRPNQPDTPEGGAPAGESGDDGTGDDVSGGDTVTGGDDTSTGGGDTSVDDSDTSSGDGELTGGDGADDSGSSTGGEIPPAPGDTTTGDDTDLTVGAGELETAEFDQVLGTYQTADGRPQRLGTAIGGGSVLGAGGAVAPVGASADARMLAATGTNVWVLLGAALAALSIGVLAVRRSAAGTPQR